MVDYRIIRRDNPSVTVSAEEYKYVKVPEIPMTQESPHVVVRFLDSDENMKYELPYHHLQAIEHVGDSDSA